MQKIQSFSSFPSHFQLLWKLLRFLFITFLIQISEIGVRPEENTLVTMIILPHDYCYLHFTATLISGVCFNVPTTLLLLLLYFTTILSRHWGK